MFTLRDTPFDFGLRLKKLRLDRKLTQAQVAAHLGVSKNTVSRYEHNEQSPTVERLKDMAILYRCTSDYIIGLEDIPSLKLAGLKEEVANSICDLVNVLNKEQNE